MNVIFLGDIYLDEDYLKCDAKLLLGLDTTLKDADFVVANLESPITLSEKTIAKVGPNLKMVKLPEDILKSIDIFSLANNHMMDYSVEGLIDTMAYLDSRGKQYFGAGVDIDNAYREVVLEKNERKVALIGMAENEFSLTFGSEPGVAPIDPIYAYSSVSAAISKYEHVVLFIHGGNEFSSLPSPRYRRLCHMFIDMGVAAIISSHTHIIGPIEQYRGKPIFYSLGNFLFNSNKDIFGWEYGLIAKLNFNADDVRFSYIPFEQSIRTHGAKIISGMARDKFECEFILLCNSITNKDEYDELWDVFVKLNSENYLFRVTSPFIFKGAYRIFKLLGIQSIFYKGKSRLLKNNYISCESHREVVLHSLTREN